MSNEDPSKTDDGQSRLTVGLDGNDIVDRLRRNTVADCMMVAPEAAKEIERLRKSLAEVLCPIEANDTVTAEQIRKLYADEIANAHTLLTPN